jgi:hypothetical protein
MTIKQRLVRDELSKSQRGEIKYDNKTEIWKYKYVLCKWIIDAYESNPKLQKDWSQILSYNPVTIYYAHYSEKKI